MAGRSDLDLMVDQVRLLSKEDFLSVMKSIAKDTIHPEASKIIVNAFNKTKRRPGFSGGNDSQRNAESRPPHESSKSAWQCPTIFRGDLVPVNDYVVFEVEKVSLKKGYNPGFASFKKNKHLLVGANLSVVDYKGTLILWVFIKYDVDEVCQWNTKLTKLDRMKIGQGISLTSVHEMLDIVFKDNILVGHSVDQDLASLNYTFKGQKIIDVADYFIDTNYQKFKLKDILSYFKENSSFQEDEHSLAKDARATLHVFLLMELLKKNGIWTGKDLKIKRSGKEKIVYDVCKCECVKVRR